MDRATFDVGPLEGPDPAEAAPDERTQLFAKLNELARERGIDPRTLTFGQAEQLLAEDGADED